MISRSDGKGLDEAAGAGIKHRKLAVATRDEEAMAGLVQLFYAKKARFHVLPENWRLTMGSLAEEMLMAPLAPSVFFLLLYWSSHR